MWNHWTSNAAFVFCATAIAAPPEAPTVRYAWMTISATGSEYHAKLPVEGDWDACVLAAPIAPFSIGEVALLELTTGEIVPGSLVGVDGDRVSWRSPRLGERSVALSDVAAIRMDGRPIESEGALLRNGDALRAPLGLGDRVTDAAGLSVSWERISGVRLHPTGSASTPLRVWLRNGGVLFAQRVEPRPGGLLMRTDSGAGLYRLDEIVALTRAETRLRPLGPPAVSAEGVSARETSLTARAPATAEWRLSGAPLAIVGAARTPEDSRAWGDALYSLWIGSDLVVSGRVSPDRPIGAVAAGVRADAGDTLTLSVQPGSGGKANGVLELSLVVVEKP